MQLHHVDGNNKNNTLDNLQMLCPNCHSQTENYCGSANVKDTKKYYCPDCGKEINKGSRYCPVCAHNHKNELSGKCPKMEQLIQDYLELKTFTKVANKYTVTDNTVRKWFKNFGLPYYANELTNYLNSKSIEEIRTDVKNDSISFKKTSNTGGQFKYDHNLILKLIDLQYTTNEISEYLGCSRDTIKMIGSKNKHSIRKANVQCIGCYKDNKLIKFCFGGCQTARWLINEQNYNQYSERTLSDMIIPSAKKGISINGILFKIRELPKISEVLEYSKEELLNKLIYKEIE